jgi:hypothetical protein
MGVVGFALLPRNLLVVPNSLFAVVGNQTVVEGFDMTTRYRVELAQTVIERATVWMEANSQDEAEAFGAYRKHHRACRGSFR